MAQQLSSSELKFIAKHEGWSSTVYPDTSGNPTIGYGHLVKKGEDFSKGISTEQGLKLLSKDVKSAVSFVNKNLKVGQTQNQFDALVDLSYNSPRAGGIMIRAINSYNGGPPEIGPNPFIPTRADFVDTLPKQWDSIPGLMNRRTDESNLYSLGIY